MKMVESYLEFYVIVISSAIILGTSYATMSSAHMSATGGQHNQPLGNKIYFDTNVGPNASVDIGGKYITGTQSKSSRKPKFLQSSHKVATPSKDPVGHSKETHPYFAVFDPIRNITRKAEVSPQSTFPRISYGEFSHLLEKSVKSENIEDDSGKNSIVGGEKMKNFIEWDTMKDSEKEIRIHYNGITAKETAVRTGIDEDTGKSLGLKLRQLTDGKHFIQLIYNFNDEIQDCEYIQQKKIVEKFLKTFRKNLENAERVYENLKEENEGKNILGPKWDQDERDEEEEEEDDDDDDDDYLEDDEGKIEKYSPDGDSEEFEGENFGQDYKNVTFQIIEKDSDMPKELAHWMNYPRLKRQCRQIHKVLKQLAYNRRHGNEKAKKLAEEHIERMKRNLDFSLIFPGTKWCGKSHIADKYTALGGFSKTDKCCRAHDHCHPLISAFEEKYGFYNFRPFTVSHCRCDLRRKRDIMDVLLVPGTKWCGKGRRATKYTSLGGFSKTDKCCRVHDTMCPYWIGSMEEKYGLFNWRINTIMHCRCDKRFRACLKMAKTGTANFVGKLFFNVVQTKCFVLKPQEVCVKYSWWTTCEKSEFRKRAYLKDNLSY